MRIRILLLTVFMISGLSCPALFADINNLEIWPFADSLSSVPVWQFDLGQKPSIYVNLPEPNAENLWISKVFSDWNMGTTLKGENDQEGLLFRRVYELSLPSTFDWTDKSNIGTWNVTVDYKYYYWLGTPSLEPFSTGTAYVSFSIIDPNPNTVPEPVATVLFLFGGAALATRRLFKK